MKRQGIFLGSVKFKRIVRMASILTYSLDPASSAGRQRKTPHLISSREPGGKNSQEREAPDLHISRSRKLTAPHGLTPIREASFPLSRRKQACALQRPPLCSSAERLSRLQIVGGKIIYPL